jgi:CheY-like chemotaxis protein
MGERILLVDDESRLLDGLRRTLRGRYVITTGTSGQEGLDAITASVDDGSPFAVVVSDMMMPGMSGSEFLTRARPLVPDAALMILSGQADLTSTITAVNNANLFRFLTKPCDPDDLIRALDAALRQHQLQVAERELLQNTLAGAVDVLTDVLSMASPIASRRTERTRTVVRVAAQLLGLDDDWRLPIAAMLSHLGCIALPDHVLEQVDAGQELEPAEREMWRGHPQVGRRLLARIPRLGDVARWVGDQPMSLAAADSPGDPPGDDLAACLLPAVAAFLVHHDAKTAPRDTARTLRGTGRYPVAVVEAVLTAVAQQVPRGVVAELRVASLMPGMVIHDDVRTSGGMVLVREGERVTDALIARLSNFAATVGVQEPFHVLVDD